MRHTGGGLRLVALTVLAVGTFAMPTAAKQDPGNGHTPPGQDKTPPPGQVQKQASQEQQAPAQQAAPAAASAQQQAPAPDKHAAKQQAKAQRKATKRASVSTQTTRQPAATTELSKQQVKAAQKGNGKASSATQAAQPSQTQSSLPPGQAKKVAAPVAPAPAAASSSQVTTTGSFTAAKTHHTARKHAARAKTPTSRPTGSSVATISPTPLAAGNPAAKTTAAKHNAGGFVPAKPATHDDAPGVVFRTVRDAVQVVPTTIWVLLGLLTALASLFAVTSARQTRRAHRLAAERGTLLGDVGVLQEAVLPVVPPRVGALAVSVAHRPVGGPAAGGDFYDVIPLEGNRTALVVGDVSGHGSGALGQATLVRFTLRAHLESGAGPREALAIAADSLAPHFDEGFATAAVAIHDPDEGTLTYATAAHEAPIVVGPGGHHPVLVLSTPPLGIGPDGPTARRQTTLPFPEKSLACMLTDGALEARVRGELVGRARVEEWVRELGARPAAGDMAELIRSRAAVSDDLAVCFATSTEGEESGNWRVEDLYRPTPAEAERFLAACGASDEHMRAATEALRFSREGTVLSVRFEDDEVVSADVLRSTSPKPVAA